LRVGPSPARKKPKRSSSSNHSKFAGMIKSAISADKNPSGSSLQSIRKYIMSNYNLKGNPDSKIKVTLRKLVSTGTLQHASRGGLSGPFKLTGSRGSKTSIGGKKRSGRRRKMPTSRGKGRKRKGAGKRGTRAKRRKGRSGMKTKKPRARKQKSGMKGRRKARSKKRSRKK
uniref:Histone H1.0-like n=1 Tax=Erpetoichthys calabaricus TaxID=27687 RepID=A0A8C4SZM8_ERPCA